MHSLFVDKRDALSMCRVCTQDMLTVGHAGTRDRQSHCHESRSYPPVRILVEVDDASLGACGIERAVCGGCQRCRAEAALIDVPAQAAAHAHVPHMHNAITACSTRRLVSKRGENLLDTSTHPLCANKPELSFHYYRLGARYLVVPWSSV